MNIVILGAGSIGGHLANVLSKEEHNIILIDRDSTVLEKMARNLDIGIRHGLGTDWELLEELAELSPQLFIAACDVDEVNLTACAIAKNLGYAKTVARIKQTFFLNRSRLDFNRLFFVDHLIATDSIVAHDLFKCIMNPGNSAVENFAHGAVQMRTLTVPEMSFFAGKEICELNLPKNLLIGLIRRSAKEDVLDQEKQKVIFPKGRDQLFAGDEVTLIGETTIMPQLHKLFGTIHKDVKSVVIAGGSPISFQLTAILLANGISVKIIEKDEKICRLFAEQVPDATILNQDMTDLNFLLSEKIAYTDVFVSCTLDNETNILSAAMAKQAGCGEIIALISDTSYAPLLKSLGIFYTVSSRISFANRIHAIVNAEHVISVASLYDNQAKIMEIKVSKDCQIVGIPISNLSPHLPKDFLIAIIENRGRIMIAKGNHILTPGDTVILICSPKSVSEVEKIF